MAEMLVKAESPAVSENLSVKIAEDPPLAGLGVVLATAVNDRAVAVKTPRVLAAELESEPLVPVTSTVKLPTLPLGAVTVRVDVPDRAAGTEPQYVPDGPKQIAVELKLG